MDINPFETDTSGVFFDWGDVVDRRILTYGPFELRLAQHGHSTVTEDDRAFQTALLDLYNPTGQVLTEDPGESLVPLY